MTNEVFTVVSVTYLLNIKILVDECRLKSVTEIFCSALFLINLYLIILSTKIVRVNFFQLGKFYNNSVRAQKILYYVIDMREG